MPEIKDVYFNDPNYNDISYVSEWINVSNAKSLSCSVFCSQNCDIVIDYAFDFDYEIVHSLNNSLLAGDDITINVNVSYRYFRLSVLNIASTPCDLKCQAFFNNSPQGFENIGTGSNIYNQANGKLRSIISNDGTITVQQLENEINLSATGLAIDNRDYTFASGSDITFPSPAPADPKRAFWSRNSNIIYPQWLTPENVGVLRSISIQPFSNQIVSSTGYCDTPTNITGGTVDFYLIEVTSSNYDLATATYNTLWHWEIPYTEFNTTVKNYECKSTYGNLTSPIVGGKKLSFLMVNNLTVSASAGFRALTTIFSFSKLQATIPLTDLGQVSTNTLRTYTRVGVLNKIQLDVYNPQHPNLNVDLINDDLIFTASGTYNFNFTTSCNSNANYRLYVNGILTNNVSLLSGIQSSSFTNVSINGGDLVQLYFTDGGTGTMNLNSYSCTITS
jgi:hypothetical protein